MTEYYISNNLRRNEDDMFSRKMEHLCKLFRDNEHAVNKITNDMSDWKR